MTATRASPSAPRIDWDTDVPRLEACHQLLFADAGFRGQFFKRWLSVKFSTFCALIIRLDKPRSSFSAADGERMTEAAQAERMY